MAICRARSPTTAEGRRLLSLSLQAMLVCLRLVVSFDLVDG